jgi:hypothetical protein
MSKEWFLWYVEQVGKVKDWAQYKDRYLCPCCYMPTLEERAAYDICPICFWEDDGQDSDDADLNRGGPNHGYTLTEARENFKKYHTMYCPSDKNHFEREMSEIDIKKNIYQAFVKAIESDSENDWKYAIDLQEKYTDDS